MHVTETRAVRRTRSVIAAALGAALWS
ncbi:MAG: hypothetical protein JWQ17_6176, partial [Tardiphaga sp.]|nr:hypothetical protein [Tardiphaga sp.]